MRRCAFLTLDKVLDFVIDDELAYAPFRELGWEVEAVPWCRPGVRWDVYDAVIIRSTWDYQSDPERFLAVLGEIEGAGVPLFNDLRLVRWNLSKAYLHELEARGVPVVPTIWRDRLESGELGAFFDELASEEIVVKPLVGANADGAYRLDRRAAERCVQEVASYYVERPLLVQPLARSILTEGELSLFYFDGEYSHCVLKTPEASDFRVQEEHGGAIRPVTPGGELRAAGARALEGFERAPLYARVDLVRSNDGETYWLMELEVIEPSLYFRMDADAPARFARAFHRRVSGG